MESNKLNKWTTVAGPALSAASKIGQAIISGSNVAKYNNPRIAGLVATPPIISISSTLPGSFPNQYVWSASTGNVFNFYGGAALNEAGYRGTASNTVSGTRSAGPGKLEVTIDCAKVAFAFYGLDTTSAFRVLVNGQYTSLTPAAAGISGFYYLVVDFTSSGGRAVRNIAVEYAGNALFYSANVSLTEGIYKPGGDIIRIAVVGDSYTAGSDASYYYDCYTCIMGDYLGAKDIVGLGIGSTGYLANASDTQRTARGRVSDVGYVSPDIVCVCLGRNDTTFTRAQIQTECGLYFPALRAQVPNAPIIVFGVFGGNVTASCLPVEAGILAAFTAWDDSNSYYVPVSNDPNGAWFTGTGNTGNMQGNGNCDIYISSTDNVHPNEAGHAFLGGRCSDAISRIAQAF